MVPDVRQTRVQLDSVRLDPDFWRVKDGPFQTERTGVEDRYSLDLSQSHDQETGRHGARNHGQYHH